MSGLPSFGPHGCVKSYCCLFVYIESLLRSDGRYQTERGSVSGVSNEPNPFYVAHGPPFIRSRGHRQVATQTRGVKMEKECGRYIYLYCRYSVSYLTLTAGDKGIKCPSVLPKQCRKVPTAHHDGSLVSFACHHAPLAAQPPATRAWKGP